MSTKIKGKKLFGMSLLLTISLVFVLGIIGLKKINSTLAQTNSVDAIAIRILENPNHYSALEWYKSKGFSGSPQSVIVDGYEAVRDGRTVYVNAANVINGVVANTLYTNIYLISYNQEAEKSTVDIFSRILANWKFNYNQPNTGHCRNKATTACLEDDDCGLGNFCDSQKARIIRDVRRLADLSLAKEIIEKYHSKKGYYPKLDAGSYLPHRTYSVWPSWREELGKELGGNLPVDPVNKIGDCPGFNEDTCWNETTLRFATTPPDLPQNSLVYSYNTFPGGTVYDICAVFESGATFAGASVCAIPVCLDFDHDGYGSPASNKCTTHPDELDCNDNDATVHAATGPENCTNGIDDDCDGFIDCADAECYGASGCIGSSACGNGACDPGENCGNCPSDCCPTTCDGICNTTTGSDCTLCYDPTGTIASHPGGDCYCGDGLICPSREQCDDGNNISGDGCSANCQIIEASSCVNNDHDGYDTCNPGDFGDDGQPADCNDNNTLIHPGATEICDGLNNNCNGSTDEGFTNEQCRWVCLAQGWNWAGNATLLQPNLNCCGNDLNEAGPYEITETSCSDGHDNNCNGLTDMADANCGGGCNNTGEDDHINAATPAQCNQCTVNGDQDGDQTIDNLLDDWSASGGFADQCDNDCNSAIATTVPRTRYLNNENNTYSIGAVTYNGCTDSYDNNCNGLFDCADPNCQATAACCINECTAGQTGCTDGTTRWDCANTDADPCLERRNTSCIAPQVCNAGICAMPCIDNDGDGYSTCAAQPDCDDNNPIKYPGATESCDGYDNNCNGSIDEGCDNDNDDYCDSSMSYFNNWAVPPYLPIGPNPCPNTINSATRDCNDTNASIHPGAVEICDGLDNDCNAATADGSGEVAPLNSLQNGVCIGSRQICNGASGWQNNYVSIVGYQANEKTPIDHCSDGIDNDCDGLTDGGDTVDCTNSCTFTFTFPCTF